MDSIKKKTLESLELHKGIVSNACKAINLPRSTFYKWKDEDREFALAVEEINEVSIDYVESKLFEKINGVTVQKGIETDEDGEFKASVYTQPPSDTAIIFYLKTKGKKRGYIEKSEVEVSNPENQVFQIGGQTIKF